MKMTAMSWTDHSVDERLWVVSVRCEQLADLFSNPVYFVQNVAGRKLGNLQSNPVVTINVKYPCGCNEQTEEPAGEVLIEGIADTNYINVRVIETQPVSADVRGTIDIPVFDPQHPVHVMMRPQEGLAIAHFHFDGNSAFRAKNAYWTARYPISHFQQIQDRINELLASDQSGATIMISDAYGHPYLVKNVVVEPKTPCIYTCQFDTATMAIGGCNSAVGTYTTENGTYTVCLDTVCCSVYAPVPP
jgi:hypothetical protein